MMQDEKRELVHRFMEKFGRLQKVMRKSHDGKKKFIFLLLTIQDLNDGKPFTTSQLAQKMDVTNAASSQMVDKLVHVGLVERIADENDRRVSWVCLTEKGKQSLRLAYTEAASFIEGLIEYLGEEDTKLMEPLMDKILDYALSKNEGLER